jgi:nucleotide-binding universal stress UspA family protein
MKITIYHDDSELSLAALRTGASLAARVGQPFTIVTARPGTAPIEQQPEYGEEVERASWEALPPGLNLLSQALQEIEALGLIEPVDKITPQEEPSGERFFYVQTIAGLSVRFTLRFGDPFDAIQSEIYTQNENNYSLLVIADPGKKGIHRMFTSNLAHRACLDLMTSVLAVKGEHLDDSVFLCADGSSSARRAYPVLNWMLPALPGPFKVIGITLVQADEVLKETCEECAKRARAWLASEDKETEVLIREGEEPAQIIMDEAGDEAIIVVGASMRSDLSKRLLGGVSMSILENSKATVLLAKALPDDEMTWGE